MRRVNKTTKKIGKKLPFWTKWATFIIGTLSLIISIVVIIVTLLTLREIRTQRIKTSQPELRLIPQPLNIICRIDNLTMDKYEPDFDLLTYNKELDSSVIEFFHNPITHKKTNHWYTLWDQGNQFKMPVYNIGQGMAIDVKVEYELDTIYFLNFFNKYKALNNQDSIFIKDKCFYFTNKNQINFIFEFNKPYEFPFISMLSQTKDTAKITIPAAYFKLIGIRHTLIYCYTSDFSKTKKKYPDLDKFGLITDFPPFYVILKYSDINGVNYIRRFECKPIVKA